MGWADGARFASAGAVYTGIDLTSAASALARRRFELFKLRGNFAVADAENLPFPDHHFDLVYSHGVLHHTPFVEAIRDRRESAHLHSCDVALITKPVLGLTIVR